MSDVQLVMIFKGPGRRSATAFHETDLRSPSLHRGQEQPGTAAPRPAVQRAQRERGPAS